jgi:hypothetical protein
MQLTASAKQNAAPPPEGTTPRNLSLSSGGGLIAKTVIVSGRSRTPGKQPDLLILEENTSGLTPPEARGASPDGG